MGTKVSFISSNTASLEIAEKHPGGFVELGRRFQRYHDEEPIDDIANQSYLSAHTRGYRTFDWEGLLGHRLVVVLGEPGSGKTEELRALRRRHPESFFLRLEQLVTEDVKTILSDAELERLEQWKKSNNAALFLLDAVDESKLKRDDDFIAALDRLGNTLGPARFRARLIVSSRISEWRPHTDREAIRERFVAPPEKPDAAPEDILIATILPLAPIQVRTFAENRGVQDAEKFIEALNEHNAWPFAGRPLDVVNLYDYWKDKRELGGLTALTEYMVRKLLAEVSSKERGDPLTAERARAGAEYLAAAAVLCKNLKFAVPDDAHISGQSYLAAELVLPSDWTSLQRRALLDRALFDSESRGALSFHHRSHVEYLAASWIEGLMQHNCSFESLQELLFASSNGAITLRASMRPVAPWLVKRDASSWRPLLENLLLATAPEIHLQWGDPAALPIEYRKRVLAAIVQKYHSREYVPIEVDLESLARIADSELATDISTYLLDSEVSDGLKARLLFIIMEGKLTECVGSVIALFELATTSEDIRRYSVLAVRDAGTGAHKRSLAECYPRVAAIDNKTLGYLFETLFPTCLSVEGALELLQRTASVRRHEIEFLNSVKSSLVEALDDENVMPFLRGIVAMLANPPTINSLRVSEQYYWVSELIVPLLAAALRKPRYADTEVNIIFDAVLLVERRIMLEQPDNSGERPQLEAIRNVLRSSPELRRAIFWRRVAQFRASQDKEPLAHRLNPYHSVLRLSYVDLDWLISDSIDATEERDRKVAIEVALSLSWATGKSLPAIAWKLRRTFARRDIRPLVLTHLKYRVTAPFNKRYDKYIRQRLFDAHWRTMQQWRFKHWRDGVQRKRLLWTHLRKIKSGKYVYGLKYLLEVMQDGSSSKYGVAAWEKVRAKWGRTFAAAAEAGCFSTWLTFSPELPSERKVPNSMDVRASFGLIALQSEWEAGRLTLKDFGNADVTRAVRYACSELNGLPDWFESLALAFPREVADALSPAIDAEFKYAADRPLVHEVTAKLASAKSPTQASANAVWRILSIADPLHNDVLKQATTTLVRAGDSYYDELAGLASTRVKQYELGQARWLTWMGMWLKLDALPAIAYLESVLADCIVQEEADNLVISLSARLGGRFGGDLNLGRASYLSPTSLGSLLPLVCRYVRREDDIDRTDGGVYSPDARDDAQDFRGRLWEVLRTSDSAECDSVLRRFLDDKILPDYDGWIRNIQDERNGKQADPTAWLPEDVRSFGEHYRHKPRSNYQLYQLAKRLIVDIQAHVERSENATDRLQVRSGDKEVAFQGFLKRHLDGRSLSWFSVTQESTIDLNQRPDLRIEIPGLNAVPVEVKLANLGWTIEQLLERLEIQLVGQYLRAEGVKFGIYVVGNTEPTRRWQRPADRKLINFAEVISILQARASELAAQYPDNIHGLSVVGFDFSDPRER
ncbi:conserved hypothetical protein [Paraburkholderia tropica]|uniref:hypothetical protein n=1 Tax=Paraburkholderia tropica TaxID=92647 RepID=UPI001CAED333|nr:hypothetical protein [Paraburkholderia tropica]CAG9217847.1 conserved hypothetical protein [Paraburkholderia tropica]